MALSKAAVVEMVTEDLIPQWRRERTRLDRIDKWLRHENEKPRLPRRATREHRRLVDLSLTPWISLIVTSTAQALYVDGYRGANAQGSNAQVWDDCWQRNGMDARQIAVHRAALGYGDAYVRVLQGDPVASIRGVSPRKLLAVYADPAEDDWPMFTIDVERSGKDHMLQVMDEELVYFLGADADLGGVQYIDQRPHEMPYCPVVRFTNMMDLEGRSLGEVEPFIPLAARIDQTIFDRLAVQHHASWIVKTIAGLIAPKNPDGSDPTPAQMEQLQLQLAQRDILVAEDADTKFGSLPASPLGPFIDAKDADIRDLAAISQTPPHYLLGQAANLSGDALAAAETSLMRKVEERQAAFGESWERVLRLAAAANGDTAGAEDMSSQVQWRDTESRVLVQVATALGILAKQLDLPAELLWTKVPGLTQQDIERATQLRAQADTSAQLMATLDRMAGTDATGDQ